MGDYSTARNFFEINMIKDYNSEKFKKITSNEVQFLQRNIPDNYANVLDVMCGYGRLSNMLFKLGYKNIFGVDIGNFNFIPEQKLFKFYNFDFYNWKSPILFDYCYSLYNSYNNYQSFLDTINKCNLVLKEDGILIIDIFNKEWRDKLPDFSHRIINENIYEKVELFRYYDGRNEESVYRISNSSGIKEFLYSQCVINKEELLSLIPNGWHVTITDSRIEKTRDDNQKNILILRKKV